MKQGRSEMTFCTTREAASLLGVSLRTVQLWSESGLLQGWKTEGGHRRLLRSSVEGLLANKSVEDLAGHMAKAIQSDQPPQDQRRMRILVAEDDPVLLRLYRVKLSQWSICPEVETVANGYQALVKLGSFKPDLLIADLHMPAMDGFRMLHTLRAMPELDAVEIVVVTGLDREEVAARGGLPADVLVLPKPVPFEKLESIAMRIATDVDLHPLGTSLATKNGRSRE